MRRFLLEVFEKIFWRIKAGSIILYRNDKALTTLTQGCHNYSGYNFVTACYNLTQLCNMKMWQSCSKGCGKVVTKLPQPCRKVGTMLLAKISVDTNAGDFVLKSLTTKFSP